MFKTEKDLVRLLKHNCTTICAWNITEQNVLVSEEIDLGFGVADLVISKITPQHITNYILSNNEIYIYVAIAENKNITLNELSDSTKLSTSKVRKYIQNLIFNKLIIEEEGRYYAISHYPSVMEECIAIEAKLKNWKRALNQAYRYKWFASASYVVMDREFINPALKCISEFEKYNVGLAEIDIHGRVKIHFKPIDEKPFSPRMEISLSEKLKEYLFASQISLPYI